MSDPQPLNYAPPPPLHRRQIFRRWIYTIVLSVVFASGWWWAPLAWRRVELLYWQHRCMVYSPPVNQVVYSSTIAITPTEWSRFYELYSPPGSMAAPVLFMHEMRAHRGQRRLVVIQLNSGLVGDYIASLVFVPGSLTSAPVELPYHRFEYPSVEEIGKADNIYAGHIDPEDPTHFTLRVIKNGAEIVLDGWMQNDGTVAMGERKHRANVQP